MKLLIRRFFGLPAFIPFIALGLIPIIWFWGKGNVLVNGIDTNFPLDPVVWIARRFFVWNSFGNAGSDFSSSTAGLFFHLVQVVPYWLGLNLQAVQIISFIFWFSLIIFSARFLARTIFPKRFLVQLLFVVLYSFNIFLFNSWENVKVANLSLVSAIPLAVGLLIRLWEGEWNFKKAAIYSVVTGIVVSGTGINPAYFVSFFFILIAFYVGNVIVNLRRNFLTLTQKFLLTSLLIILVNAFWIIPTLYFIFQNIAPAGSIDRIGFNNWINSLSENTSIVNVMRGQGAWDWYAFESQTNNLPLYIPYAINYFYNLPFIVFSFLLPGLAIFSLLFRNKRTGNLYFAFGMMFVVSVFLGAGTHLPTGAFYRWLSGYLPFFTLFRSPWYIFTPLLTLSTAGLICLLFVRVQETLGAKPKMTRRLIGALTMLTLIIGNLLYSYPLITGKIFRPGRDDGFYINFPSYIFDAKPWLSQNSSGRIIGYPDDEIEKFTWKYRGIESILALIVEREVLFPPLNAPDSPIARLIKQFYQDLKKNQLSAATSVAAKMNASLLFEKRDQDSIAFSLPEGIKSFPSKEFSHWNFFDLTKNAYLPKIYSPSHLVFDHSKGAGQKVIGILKNSEVLVNPDDMVVIAIPGVFNLSSRSVLAHNSRAEELETFVLLPSKLATRLLKRDPTQVEFDFDIPKDGIYQPILERFRLEDFGVDITKGIMGDLDSNQVSLAVNDVSDSFVYLEAMNLSKGTHKFRMRLKPVNLLEGGFENGPEFTERGRGAIKILGNQDGNYLSILNSIDLSVRKEQDIGARFAIRQFDPISDYLIQFKYRQIYGENGMVIVGQDKGDVLVRIQVERLPNYPEWNTFSFFYAPVQTESEMKIELIAPHIGDPLGTKVLFDDLEIYKVFQNRLIFVQRNQEKILSQPKIDFDKLSPSEYRGIVEDAAGRHVIVFSENYSPKWQLSVFDTEGKKMDTETLHFSANTYANAWYIEGAPSSYKFSIYYQPQNLFILGSIISISTPAALLIFSSTISIMNFFGIVRGQSSKRRSPLATTIPSRIRIQKNK